MAVLIIPLSLPMRHVRPLIDRHVTMFHRVDAVKVSRSSISIDYRPMAEYEIIAELESINAEPIVI